MNSGLPSVWRWSNDASASGTLAVVSPNVEILGDLGLRERPQHDLAGQVSRDQVALEGMQRLRRARDIRGPVRGDDQDLRGEPVARERGDQVEGGGVRPVEILEDEQQRRRRGDRLERLADLAQHPLSRGAEDLLLERLAMLAA